MSFLSSVGHFLGNLFGGDDNNDPNKKKQQNQFQQYTPPGRTASFGASKPQPSNDPAAPPPDNSLNLFQGTLQKPGQPQNGNFQPFDPNALMKANPPVQPAPAPAGPPDTRSTWQKLSHNPVTNFAGDLIKVPLRFSENYSNTFANLGNKLAGAPNQTIQQNMGGDPVSDRVLKVSGATGKNAQLAGDAGTIALTALAPGVENLAELGATRVAGALAPETASAIVNGIRMGLPYDVAAEAASKLFPTAVKYGTGALTGGLLNTGFGAINEGAAGANPGEILKKVPQNFGLGSLLGVATPAVVGGLKKAAAFDSGVEEAGNVAAADELAPGVKSANPNQAADAASAAAEQAAKEADQARIAQEADNNAGANQAANTPEPVAPPEPITPTSMSSGELDALNALEKTSKERVLSTPEQAVRTALQEKKDAITLANNPEPVTPETPATAPKLGEPTPSPQSASAPVGPSPAESVAAEAQAAPGVTPIAAAPAGPVEPVAPAAPLIPGVADLPAGGEQVPVAPNTRAAIVNQLGDIGKSLGEGGKMRPETNLDELKGNASNAIATMSDDDVVNAFSSNKLDGLPHDVNGVAVARAAIDRLSKMDASNPDVVDALENAMDAIADRSSQSGLIQRFVQEDFDKLPIAMKVRYLVRNIDRANAAVEGYAPLAEDPARAAVVEQTITNHLNASEAIAGRISETQDTLTKIAEAAKSGEKADVNIRDLTKQLAQDQRDLAANNGKLADYYKELIPGRSLGQKTNDWARTMMLGSFAGRINDVATTTSNIANQGVQNVVQGAIAKGINFFKPGATLDTLRGTKAFLEGTGEGLKKSQGEFKGANYVDDLQTAVKADTAARTGLSKATNPVSKLIQSATEFATNASEGVRNQRLYQLAVKEGQQEGLSGDLLDQYAQARAAVPTRQMVESADILHKQINNLNENPISRGLNRVSAGIASDKPGVAGTISGLIKNQIIPFTSWLGGNIWNSITDKNVAAQFTKLLGSAAKGDVDGVVQHLAGTATNAAYTYALGWLMTQHGLITNHGPVDPSTGKSYNDAGAYFHIGDRYIPVAFTGFFAPSVILGNAAYNGFHSNPGDPAHAIADSASQTILNGFKSGNVASALGADNNITRTIGDVNTPGSKITAGDIAAQTAGNVGGQFIPAATGDVNSLLNNGLKIGGRTIIPDTLNPTHEAANTTVKKENPATGNMVKDPTASAGASFVNRIPFASQALPRKAGVAAPDFADKITKGTRDTTSSNKAASDIKQKADQATDFKARNVPDPNGKNFDDAVESRIEDGKYDSAIEGLNAKLKANQSNKDIPASKNKKIEDQIKQLTVTKQGGFEPKTIDMYKKTSLSEWRDMGDPESDAYDPTTYANLYRYDQALAKAGVSRNSTKGDITFFSPKKPAKGKGGSSGANAALNKIKSNTIGSTPDLKDISFGDLAPQKISNVKIPTIQNIKAGDLIKKRKITVGKAI